MLVVVVGQASTQHGVEDDAQAPHVSCEAVVAGSVKDDFGGGVIGASAGGVQELPVLEGGCKTVVGEEETAVLVYEYVFLSLYKNIQIALHTSLMSR